MQKPGGSAVLAGDGTSEALAGSSDGSVATSLFRRPEGLFYSELSRKLYVADTGNQLVRVIDLNSGMVSTIAGTLLTRGYSGDNDAAASALLHEPVAVTECPNGDLFIAEKVATTCAALKQAPESISTVLGVGIGTSVGVRCSCYNFSRGFTTWPGLR